MNLETSIGRLSRQSRRIRHMQSSGDTDLQKVDAVTDGEIMVEIGLIKGVKDQETEMKSPLDQIPTIPMDVTLDQTFSSHPCSWPLEESMLNKPAEASSARTGGGGDRADDSEDEKTGAGTELMAYPSSHTGDQWAAAEEGRAGCEEDTSENLSSLPQSFYCPITKVLMINPVVQPSGDSIELTTAGQPCDQLRYPNRALQALIRHKLVQCEQTQSSGPRALEDPRPKVTRPLPDALYCPITGDLFYEPVIDPEGNTYERHAIHKWIQLHGTSPITRQPLSVFALYDNKALLNALLEETEGEESTIRPSLLNWRKGLASRQVQGLESQLISVAKARSTPPASESSHSDLDQAEEEVDLQAQERRAELVFCCAKVGIMIVVLAFCIGILVVCESHGVGVYREP